MQKHIVFAYNRDIYKIYVGGYGCTQKCEWRQCPLQTCEWRHCRHLALSGCLASLAIASHSQHPVRLGERDVLRYVATRKSGPLQPALLVGESCSPLRGERRHLALSGGSASLAIASHSQYPVPLGCVAASGSGSHLAQPNGSFRLGERDVLRYVALASLVAPRQSMHTCGAWLHRASRGTGTP